ncbi:hypothetical protein [Nocardia asteroides]|uniref:hypothetical protein n=1 Tax=Nocardia asteroides TaxID=1824 RepID=UPI001E656144|nr:hypothetical protein [Nocardia asteroides]UGT62633.1 hypothetical protein LTT61_04610 [Nocardia asteroides]
MKDRLVELVRKTFEEINEARSEKIPLDSIMDIGLYGETGLFDSMHLVSFLTLLEEYVEDELSTEISLTSEKAVSRRVSPFSSVAALVGFMEEEIREQSALPESV